MFSHRTAASPSRLSWLIVAFALFVVPACKDDSPPDAQSFIWDLSSPPPPLPSNSPERLSAEDAARFLVQASFGPSMEDIEAVSASGTERWLEYQLAIPATYYLPRLRIARAFDEDVSRNAPTDMFWEAGVMAPDQLRQRMVYALSQILVISTRDGSVGNDPMAVAQYMDILSDNAFGNYRDLLEDVTYSPAMAMYLTYLRNRKADMQKGNVPDENYAREIMQLFAIGLIELNPDGTNRLGAPETYDNEDVKGLAKVFTGLSYQGESFWERPEDPFAYQPLVMHDEYHSESEKQFLGLTIPAGTDGDTSIAMALDHLVAHPNTAPFVSRQLIQRFVTSHPSPAYVGRVSAAFEDGVFDLPSGKSIGDGRKGDLSATLAAILMDAEARQSPDLNTAEFGKVREPTLRLWHWARAFDVMSARSEDVSQLRDMSRQDRLGQHPFRAPSVFNFYRPQYVAPNTATGSAGLHAPELQLVSEITHVGYVNTMSSFVQNSPPGRSQDTPNAYAPQYGDELALSETPAALVDRLDTILTFGTMTQETKNRIVLTLNEIPVDDRDPEQDREARVHTAILMTMTAPEFLVQR